MSGDVISICSRRRPYPKARRPCDVIPLWQKPMEVRAAERMAMLTKAEIAKIASNLKVAR